MNSLGRSIHPISSDRRFSVLGLLRSASWLLAPVFVLVIWQLVVSLRLYPVFIIPPPMVVLERLIESAVDGRLLYHTGVTVYQMMMGLVLGTFVGTVLGYGVAKSRLLDALLSPIVSAFQSTPVVAYAPLLVIWFDGNTTGKIIISTLIVLFPVLINTVIGLRGVSSSLRDLMLSLRASRWQMFLHLEVPAALPVLLGGLRVSIVLALIGSVVGEFLIASAGLGFLINDARYRYDTALVVVAVLMLVVVVRLMHGMVALLEARLIGWQRRA